MTGGSKLGSNDSSQDGTTPAQRRTWSPPRVILSQLRSTYHQVGKNPTDKINFSTDAVTPSGSSGS
jgi:hypothetical protein